MFVLSAGTLIIVAWNLKTTAKVNAVRIRSVLNIFMG
jgi:hypothetical protein